MNLDKNVPSRSASPVWYVTNGTTVVGPIETALLLRGITSARIPSDCRVTQERWSSWRKLDEIREAALVTRTPEWQDGGAAEHEELLSRARDAGEALLLAMLAAIAATRATSGLVHRHREPFVGLVTSSVHGPQLDARLGDVISRQDAAWLAACERTTVVGTPLGGPAERAIARRFSHETQTIAGVAMVPVFDGGLLLAMIELSRADHPFRARDAESLQRIAEMVCRR